MMLQHSSSSLASIACFDVKALLTPRMSALPFRSSSPVYLPVFRWQHSKRRVALSRLT